MRLHFILNDDPLRVEVPDDLTLLDLLRDRLGLTGTKWGCRVGDCGACSVLVDDILSLSCLQLAAQVDGRHVTTIEGLHRQGRPSDLQRAFAETGAVQCGYCTPGMIVAAEALLRQDGDLDEESIRRGLEGNLCRCTGYTQIVEAVANAIRRRAQRSGGEQSDEDGVRRGPSG